MVKAFYASFYLLSNISTDLAIFDYPKRVYVCLNIYFCKHASIPVILNTPNPICNCNQVPVKNFCFNYTFERIHHYVHIRQRMCVSISESTRQPKVMLHLKTFNTLRMPKYVTYIRIYIGTVIQNTPNPISNQPKFMMK